MMKRILLPTLALLASCFCQGATIFSSAGDGSFDNFNSFQLFGESLTTTATYYNVSVSIVAEGPVGSTGTAYLTNSIGPGTTLANQIAATVFSPTVAYSSLTLFNGITLPAGPVYLVLAASTTNSGIRLQADYPTNVTLGPGVTFNGDFLASTANSYPPATSTGGLGGDFASIFSGSTVPEPSTAIYLLVGCIGLFLLIRRHSCVAR